MDLTTLPAIALIEELRRRAGSHKPEDALSKSDFYKLVELTRALENRFLKEALRKYPPPSK